MLHICSLQEQKQICLGNEGGKRDRVLVTVVRVDLGSQLPLQNKSLVWGGEESVL